MARTSGSELPSERELHEILAKESLRVAVRYDYGATQPQLFNAYKSIAKKAAADTSWVDNFSEMPLTETKYRADMATARIAEYILHNPDNYDKLFDSLCVNDKPALADVIFVFGSPGDARINLAAKLYHQKVAGRIIVSGKGPHYGEGDEPEAIRMANVAKMLGVPEGVIIQELRAITLPDNVKRTVDMLEAMDWRPESVVAIASSFTQRRAQMEWYKFTPWHATVLVTGPCDAELPPYMRRQSWANSRHGVMILLNEYNKIIVEQAMDLFRIGKVQ